MVLLSVGNGVISEVTETCLCGTVCREGFLSRGVSVQQILRELDSDK